MEKELLEVTNKAKYTKEFKEANVEVNLPEVKVTLGLLLDTRKYVVLYKFIYLTAFTSNQQIKLGLQSRSYYIMSEQYMNITFETSYSIKID